MNRVHCSVNIAKETQECEQCCGDRASVLFANRNVDNASTTHLLRCSAALPRSSPIAASAATASGVDAVSAVDGSQPSKDADCGAKYPGVD